MEQLFADKMISGAEELGISLSEEKTEQFYAYYKLLEEWNKMMNLTAITEMEDVIYKHFIDSLSVVKVVKGLEESSFRLIDVGTGAGFPGIPLKISFPNLSVVLLDSLNKRVKFLQEVINNLDLKSVEAFHGRAENFGHDRIYREKFDFCVSRAVANMSTLTEYCLPFVKIGGMFIAYKSEKLEEEMEQGRKAVSILGGEIKEKYQFLLTGTGAKRDLIVIQKKKSTDKRYPRKAGLPGKDPLGM